MGVDACIFAVKAKRSYHFGRLSNFKHPWSNELHEGSAKYKDINSYVIHSLFLGATSAVWRTDQPRIFSKAELLYILFENFIRLNMEIEGSAPNVSGWLWEDLCNRKDLNRNMALFVLKQEDDETFFVCADNTDPSFREIEKRDGYTQDESWVK